MAGDLRRYRAHSDAIDDFFSDALLISTHVLTNEINLVLKGMSRIVNSDNLQWVWINLIIHILLFKNVFFCNTVFKK